MGWMDPLPKRDKSMKRCTCVCAPACAQGVEMLLRGSLTEESEHRRRRGWDLPIVPHYLKPSFLTEPQAMSTQDSLPTASAKGPARGADLCDPQPCTKSLERGQGAWVPVPAPPLKPLGLSFPPCKVGLMTLGLPTFQGHCWKEIK